MRKLTRFTNIVAVTLISVLTMAGTVHAAEVEISADKTSCEAGDAINVDVNISTDGDVTSAPEINITYNPARLQFDNCSVEYGGGGGGLITISDTQASIAFTTMSGGDASVKVSAVLGEESCDGELTISVEGEDVAGEEENASISSTGVEANYISTDNGRVVYTVFPDEYLPKLFEKNVTSYQGQQAECARFAMGDVVLLFTTDSSESDARFMRYNESTGELSDYRMIEGIENNFIIILNEWDGDIPTGYLKSVLDWNGQTLTAFKYEAADNGSATCFAGINPNEFFLIYALSSDGTKGWYQYDLKDGTYQRFVQYTNAGATLAGSEAGDSGETSSDDETFLDDYLSRTVQMIMLFAFAGLTLILIIVVIVLGVKVADYDEYEYMDPEDYMRMQEKSKQRTSKNSVSAAAIVKKTLEDDEDDEDEEDDEDDRKSKKSKAKSESKKVKNNKIKDEDDEDEEVEDESEEDEEAENVSIDEESDDSDEDDSDDEESEDDEDEDDEDEDDEDDEEDDDDEDIEEYFAPRMSRKEAKAYEKQLRREEKLAAKEEKWRQKEEKRASKMRAKGVESNSPMDWSEFGESYDNSKASKRPMVKSSVPSYMLEEDDEEEEVVVTKNTKKKSSSDKLPARKNAPMSAQREAESAREMKEDELRRKQQRLFEQQRMLEEQRRIEQEQYEEEQRLAQEKFAMQQHQDDDLDEDFEFEFINL